jgi:hypothetical protein
MFRYFHTNHVGYENIGGKSVTYAEEYGDLCPDYNTFLLMYTLT